MAGVVTHKEVVIPPPGPLIDGVDWLAEHMFNAPEIGAVLVGDPSQTDGANWVSPGVVPNRVLITHGPGVLPTFEDAAAYLPLHSVLSAVHPDAVVGVVVQGDILFGNATPKWDRLPIGPPGAVLQSLGTVPVWVDGLEITGIWLGNLTESRVTFAGAGGQLVDDPGLRYDSVGENLLLHGGVAGTGAVGVIAVGVGTAPTTFPPGVVQLLAQDSGGSAVLCLYDEAGARYTFGSDAAGQARFKLEDPSFGGSQFLFIVTPFSTEMISGGSMAMGVGAPTTLFFESDNNIGIGTASFGTNAQKVLAHGVGVAPTTSPADVHQSWVEDIDGANTAGLRMLTEHGRGYKFGNRLIMPPGANAGQIKAVGQLFALPVAGPIANTVTETTLYTTTILGNTLIAGTALTCMLVMVYTNNSAGNANVTVRIKLGGVLLATMVYSAVPTGGARGARIPLVISGNGNAVQRTWADAVMTNIGISSTGLPHTILEMHAAAETTVDMTVNQDLIVTVQHSAAATTLIMLGQFFTGTLG